MRDLLHRLRQLLSNRVIAIGLIFALLLAILWGNLFSLQVLGNRGAYAFEQGTYSRLVNSEPIRGEIFDRFGRPIAYNEYAWSLYYDSSIEVEQLNELCLSIAQELQSYGIVSALSLAIDYSPKQGFYYTGNYAVSAVLRSLFLAEIFSTTADQLTGEQKHFTAEQAYLFMRDELFKIDANTSIDDALSIMTLRYAIYIQRFKTDEPILLADTITDEFRDRISERSRLFPTLVFKRTQKRVYDGGEAMSPIVGYLGSISEEQLAKYPDRGYDMNSLIGISGLESVYEEQLCGTGGVKKVTYSQIDDSILREETVIAGKKGDSVFITLDKDVQTETYRILRNHIKEMLCAKITGIESIDGSSYSAGEVLCSLLYNNWLDADVFLEAESAQVQQFKNAYDSAASVLTERIRQIVMDETTTVNGLYYDDLHLYNTWIEIMRDSDGILDAAYQQAGAFYESYANGEKTPHDFVEYCLYNNLFDLKYFGLEHEMDIQKLLQRFLTKELEDIQSNPMFRIEVYQYMLESGIYPVDRFLLILFDAGLLSKDDGTYEQLQNGWIGPAEVLRAKIMNDEIEASDVNLDPCSGSAIITDTDTGEVLAMVSYPSIDNNRITTDADYYRHIINNLNTPMLFRALEEVRAPGSTYKLCTAITALENGVTAPYEEIYDAYTFHEANSEDKPSCNDYHGSVNLMGAIEVSCNYYFYTMGYRLCNPVNGYFEDETGLKKMADYALDLGLGTKTGIELYEETPHTSDQDAVRSAIGQGTNAFTPANINRYTSTLLNYGSVYDFYIVDHISSAAGDLLMRTEPTCSHQSKASESSFDYVIRGMVDMANGSSLLSQLMDTLDIEIAGKTGTAQEFNDRPSHSVFTGVVNPEQPEITVTVVIPFGGTSYHAIETFVEVTENYYGYQDPAKAAEKTEE